MGVPFFMLSFEGNPFTQGYEILSRKTRVLGAAHSEDFVILACVVLTIAQCDGQTYRRTDTQAIAETR